MDELHAVAPPFLDMAHRIVWASVATVDPEGRPWSRILHPIWEWDGERLTGWVATAPTAIKRRHLDHSPYVTVSYWEPSHDTCSAECRATWMLDDETCADTWRRFADAPPPVGYDPSIIPAWTAPTDDAFAVLRLDPWRVRVMPGSVLATGGAEGKVQLWQT